MRVAILIAAALLQPASSATSPSMEMLKGADSKIADTVRALDVNGDGKVDQSEILDFAKSQGLSSDEVLADFKELDANGDGALDVTEIGPLFAAAPEEQATAKPVLKSAADAPPTSLSSSSFSIEAVAPSTPATATTIVESKPSEAKAEVGIDLIALQRDAADQASKMVASELAQRAQALIARSSQSEKKATEFEANAQALRAQAAELAKKVTEEARQSASSASKVAVDKAAPELNKMKEDEHNSKVAAIAHQEEAKKAMDRVRKVQSFLRSS